MEFSKRIALSALSLALLLQHASGFASEYAEILDTPAVQSELAVRNQLVDVTQVGKRLVAVGQRGHIVYSDDLGKTWQQANVPLSADLLAVYFPTSTDGWAVGHSGVVLHSSDAGATWTKQLDGRRVGQVMLDHYRKLSAAQPDNQQLLTMVDDAKRMQDEGEDSSFLDVWFANDKVGYIVGTFNLIFRTEDGGQTWAPLLEQSENPQGFHLNAINKIGDELFIVGEQGLVLKFDQVSQGFIAVPTAYTGTFFGLTGKPGLVLVYGLRGNVYRSTDAGASWSKVETGLPVSIAAGSVDPVGNIYLLSQAGHVLVSTDDGQSFLLREQEPLAPVAGATATTDNQLVVVGNRGVRQFSVPAAR
jgi:photosystem II stability/assembly factor-like uncharacterized protein